MTLPAFCIQRQRINSCVSELQLWQNHTWKSWQHLYHIWIETKKHWEWTDFFKCIGFQIQRERALKIISIFLILLLILHNLHQTEATALLNNRILHQIIHQIQIQCADQHLIMCSALSHYCCYETTVLTSSDCSKATVDTIYMSTFCSGLRGWEVVLISPCTVSESARWLRLKNT